MIELSSRQRRVRAHRGDHHWAERRTTRPDRPREHVAVTYCPRCTAYNPPGRTTCKNCGYPI